MTLVGDTDDTEPAESLSLLLVSPDMSPSGQKLILKKIYFQCDVEAEVAGEKKRTLER